MYLFYLLLQSHLVCLLASNSLQWNVDFRRNLRITNGTLVPADYSSLVFIKIQDNGDYSSSIQFQSVLQLVQPLFTLKLYTPYQSQSAISRILPALCLLSAPSVLCDESPDAHSISRLCDTHRARASDASVPLSHFCMEGSGLEWAWVAELPQSHINTLTAIAVIESNTFGIDIPTIGLQMLYPVSPLSARLVVPLQLVPFSLSAATAGSFLKSSLLAGNAVSLFEGEIVIWQQGELYSFDWNSTELLPITSCVTRAYTVSSLQTFANGLLASTKYGLLWMERDSQLNYTVYRDPGDARCPGYLLYEEREPYHFNLYSLDTEKGDIRMMGREGKFVPLLKSNLLIEMSQYFLSDTIDNLTVLSYLHCWVTQEIILLVSDSEQSAHLVTFDTVGSRASRIYDFPPHLPSQSESNNTATLLRLSSKSPDANRTLRIRDMKVLSNSEILLWGTSLLYSPDFGRSFYLFSQITDSITQVDILPTGRFTVITQQHQVWYGTVDSLQLQRLELETPANTTVIYQLINSNIIEFTFLSASNKLLISRHRLTSRYSPYSSSNCSSHLNSTSPSVLNSTLPLLPPEVWLTGLTRHPAPNSSCPYSSLSLLSSHCISLTREIHRFFSSLPDLPDFSPDSFTPIPVLSCAHLGEGLPRHVYLDKSYLFNVSFLIYLSPSFPCINQSDGEREDLPRVSVWLSSEIIEFHTQTLYHPLTHMLQYSVSLRANQSLNNSKLQTGSYFVTTEIKFKITPQRADCSTLDSGISSTVFIGCPSRLSIVYDREESENNDIWIKPVVCEEHPNMSCLFFDFGFIPRFYILDELREIRIPFEGYYNLRPVAAGLSVDRMVNFTNVTNPLGLWAVKDFTESPIQLHTQLAPQLQWICIHSSFCADIRPSSVYGIPIYYLTLEFSNRLDKADTSFCDFTTEFTVLIYGIPLGPMGTVVAFAVSLLIYLLILISAYPIYLFRGNIQQYYDTHVYSNVYIAVESILTSLTRLRMDFHLRKRSNKVEASEADRRDTK